MKKMALIPHNLVDQLMNAQRQQQQLVSNSPIVQLSALDEELRRALDSNEPADIKVKNYQQILHRYSTIRNKELSNNQPPQNQPLQNQIQPLQNQIQQLQNTLQPLQNQLINIPSQPPQNQLVTTPAPQPIRSTLKIPSTKRRRSLSVAGPSVSSLIDDEDVFVDAEPETPQVQASAKPSPTAPRKRSAESNWQNRPKRNRRPPQWWGIDDERK